MLYYNTKEFHRTQLCGVFNIDSNAERIAFVYYELCVMFAIPVVIMAYCYARVIHVLWRSNKNLDNMTGAR